MNKIKVLINVVGADATFKVGNKIIAKSWKGKDLFDEWDGTWRYEIIPTNKKDWGRSQDAAIDDVKHLIQYQLSKCGVDVEFMEAE